MTKQIYLTHKQSLFVLNYIKGMNGTDAAISAYNVNSSNSAAVIASENLRKLNIRLAIHKLAPNGTILWDSIRIISEGLDATKGVNGLPDWSARLRASNMGMKLLDEIYK